MYECDHGATIDRICSDTWLSSDTQCGRSKIIAQSFLGVVRFFNSMYANIVLYAR